MLKTILFSADPKLIEQYQKQGEVIIAKDPIKTLKAMKNLGNKEEYQVVGDEKYVEFSKKLGYNKEIRKETPIQTVSKLTSFYEQQLKDQEEDFNSRISRLKDETNNIKTEYDTKIKELEQKKVELEQERIKIKKAIKNAIN